MPHPILLADFIAAFGDSPGVLPDGTVVGSSRADWARVFALITDEGWAVAWHSDKRGVAMSDLLDSSRDHDSFALRPIPGVQINWFLGYGEVVFDIDLREYTNQDALDALLRVIALLGSALDRPVALSSEGDPDDVVAHFDPNSDEFTLRERR